MIKKRFAAFTIMEVTITMIISAILIGITYTAFSIFSRSYHGFGLKNQDMAMVLRLNELLQRDFDRADIVLKEADGIALKAPARVIRYRFAPDYFVRTGVAIDTFKIKTDSVITSFDGSVINEPAEYDEVNRLDELDIQLLLQNEKIPYHYHKVYSSENLINRNPDAIH
jgi:Tfp pilus assembly protein PilE